MAILGWAWGRILLIAETRYNAALTCFSMTYGSQAGLYGGAFMRI